MWIQERFHEIITIDSHDWLVYAFFRHNNYKWIIDDYISMAYRQHGHNEFGANVGLAPKVKRIKSVLSGEYFQRVISIIKVLDNNSVLLPRLSRFGFFDRIWLMCMAGKFRRDWRDVLIFRILIIFAQKP